MKIALVMPYFGALPPYFNFFLRSLEGKKLDVLFFSDLKVERHPDNFKRIPMSFDAFKALARVKLGVDVNLATPKRLCDFKPMYGKIFEDYLSGYDWWALGDCDVVYGNLFNGLLDEVLSSVADVFSLEKLFCCGPLCFVRNTAENNLLFKRARGWVGAVQSPSAQNIGFDEIGGDWFDALRTGKITLAGCARRGSCFSEAVMLSGDVKLDVREVMEQCDLAQGEVVRWNSNGELLLNDKPVCIYHYVRPKQRKFFTFVYANYDHAKSCLVDDAGFYVTSFQKRFRFCLNKWRKCKAAFRSLKRNGLARISPRWKERFA